MLWPVRSVIVHPSSTLVALYTINHTRIKPICVIQGLSPYRAVNTLHLGYKTQYINYVQGKSYCLLWKPYKIHKCNVIQHAEFSEVKLGGTYSNQRLNLNTALVRLFDVASNNKTYSGLYVNYPKFLPDFNQISIFLPYNYVILQCQVSRNAPSKTWDDTCSMFYLKIINGGLHFTPWESSKDFERET
jgi:hypothetical protein